MSALPPHDLGLHRVLSPPGALPQASTRLDATSPMFANEITLEVETLNIDSASFHQMIGQVGRDPDALRAHIMGIVAERGKMQNPVTGSGGVLLGRVKAIGPDWRGDPGIQIGTRVTTLVSLTLTPLRLDALGEIHFEADQINATGTAYLWPSSPLVAMPQDLPEALAMSALDVCGAPAQAQRLSQGATRMLILGFGKSGMLCAAAARHAHGQALKIYAIDRDPHNLTALHQAGLIDDFRLADATDAPGVLTQTLQMTQGALVDLVVNTCNIPHTEMSAILPCAERGKVYFFNMATDFGRAALGCEGIGRDADLYIGNGYAKGHAALSLDLVRTYPVVRQQLAKLLA